MMRTLLLALLDHEPRTGPWIVMVQKEVADRMCAGPGSKQYGAASVSLGRVRRISKVIDVGRSCFLPPPRVDSAVIRFDPLQAPRGEVADPEAFRKLVRACFQQRRKTLLNSLQSVGSIPLRGRPDPVSLYSLDDDPSPWPVALAGG